MSQSAHSFLQLFDLRALGRLEPAERSLLFRTALLVSFIRVGLWVLPVRRLRQLLSLNQFEHFPVRADVPISRMVWAVQAASRRIPMASCLTQSLALQFLLARSGRPSELHIGVKKDQVNGFKAHAWVVFAGDTLLSTPAEIADYAPMLSLEDYSF